MTTEERQANLYAFLMKKGDMWTRMVEAGECEQIGNIFKEESQ